MVIIPLTVYSYSNIRPSRGSWILLLTLLLDPFIYPDRPPVRSLRYFSLGSQRFKTNQLGVGVASTGLMELARVVADIIGRCAEPLIGLRHVHIYSVDGGQSVYWCGLCESICGESSPDDIIVHVATRRHRINYMKLNYLSYYDIVQGKPDDNSLLVDYSRTIEADEGRQNVRLCEGPMPTIVLQAYQAARQADAPSDPARTQPIFLGDSSIGEVLHKIAVKADEKSVGDLLRPLIPTLVTNEEEAAKALEVANRLTRALLEYRLSSSPKQ